MKRVYFAASCVILLSLRARATEVRIGVLELFHSRQVIVAPVDGKHLECASGALQWRVIRPVLISLQKTATITVSGSVQPLDEPLRCTGAGGGGKFTLAVPGKITRRYAGSIEISAASAELQMIITMELETAVASVVAAESPPGAPLEALKAQAVATRSFFLAAGRGRHSNFDFCDTTHCQFLREPPASGSAPYQAAMQTRGVVLAYQNSVFAAMYSSSCGGRTHSLKELGIPVHGYPYFSVICDYCRRHPQRWVSAIAQDDASGLNKTERGRLNLARKLGWKSVPSNSYSLRREGDSVILEGVGAGHGLGLCQRGAADMARHGASFQQILAHYYPDTTLKQLP